MTATTLRYGLVANWLDALIPTPWTGGGAVSGHVGDTKGTFGLALATGQTWNG